MPFRIQIDVDGRIVLVELTGELSADELIEGNRALATHPDFRSDLDQIVDMSTANGIRIDRHTVRQLTDQPPLFSPRSRRAFVVKTDFGYGMARMFQMQRGEGAGEIQVFRDLGEARAWLQSGRRSSGRDRGSED